MSIFKQIKDQVTADIESVLEKSSKSVQAESTTFDSDSKKMEKQMKQWKQTIEKQRKLEYYFMDEWKAAEEMSKKRRDQLAVATEANASDLIEHAQAEITGYEELANEYKESYEEQRERVKKLEERGRELFFIQKKLKRIHLTEFARSEETKAEKDASKWTYYSEENGRLDEEETEPNKEEERTLQLNFDAEIEKLKQNQTERTG